MRRAINKNGQPIRKTHEPAVGDSSNGAKRKGSYIPVSPEDNARFNEQTKGLRNIE